MVIERIHHDFSVCKVRKDFQINCDTYGEFCFTGKTDEEFSLVCVTDTVPADTLAREDGWRAFRIQGSMDFSLIGILAGISSLLAAHRIGIFVISTFNTDYVLTKRENYEKALQVLNEAGYEIQ